MPTLLAFIMCIGAVVALLILTGYLTIQHPCGHEDCEAWATHVERDVMVEREDGTIREDGVLYSCGQHADRDAVLISDDQKP